MEGRGQSELNQDLADDITCSSALRTLQPVFEPPPVGMMGATSNEALAHDKLLFNRHLRTTTLCHRYRSDVDDDCALTYSRFLIEYGKRRDPKQTTNRSPQLCG